MMGSMFLMGLLILCNFVVSSEFKFTGSDLGIIAKFRKYLNCQCVLFVYDGEDVSLADRVKNVGLSYFAVVNTSRLENVLADNTTQLNLFRSRTAIVTKEVLNLTLLLDKVTHPHFLTWIVFKDHSLFEGLCIPVNSDVFFVHSTPETVLVKQMHHLRCGNKETARTVYWEGGSFGVRKVNFQNLGMRVHLLTPRSNCRNIQKLTLLRKLECVHWDLIQILGDKLNFSLIEVECQEKEFPFIFPNGSDSELFLKLKYREVELSALGHVITTRNRRDFIDYAWPTFALRSMMYLKQGKLSGHWFSYLKPLESSVWWGILICIAVFGILLQVFEKLLKGEGFKVNFLLDLMASILRALQVFCNQAINDMPASWSIRLIYLLGFSVVLIFFQAYCGYLVSSLTVATGHFPFSDLKGFFENSQYKLMTLRKGFHQYYFRKIIGKERGTDFILQEHELPVDIQEAVDKLCMVDRLAFAEFREDLLDFDALKCRISELPKPVLLLYVGIPMPKTAPPLEFLRRELLNLRSAGLLARFARRLSSQTTEALNDKRSLNEFCSVSMYQIFTIFILYGFGIFLSVLTFAVELIAKRVRKNSRAPVRKQKL